MVYGQAVMLPTYQRLPCSHPIDSNTPACTPTRAQLFLAAIAPLIPKLCYSLDLHRVKNFGGHAFLQAMSKLRYLRILNLSDTGILPALHLSDITAACPNLVALSLADCQGFAQQLNDKHFKSQIEKARETGKNVDWRSAIGSLSGLRWLDLNSASVSVADLRALAPSLLPRIQPGGLRVPQSVEAELRTSASSGHVYDVDAIAKMGSRQLREALTSVGAFPKSGSGTTASLRELWRTFLARRQHDAALVSLLTPSADEHETMLRYLFEAAKVKMLSAVKGDASMAGELELLVKFHTGQAITKHEIIDQRVYGNAASGTKAATASSTSVFASSSSSGSAAVYSSASASASPSQHQAVHGSAGGQAGASSSNTSSTNHDEFSFFSPSQSQKQQGAPQGVGSGSKSSFVILDASQSPSVGTGAATDGAASAAAGAAAGGSSGSGNLMATPRPGSRGSRDAGVPEANVGNNNSLLLAMLQPGSDDDAGPGRASSSSSSGGGARAGVTRASSSASAPSSFSSSSQLATQPAHMLAPMAINGNNGTSSSILAGSAPPSRSETPNELNLGMYNARASANNTMNSNINNNTNGSMMLYGVYEDDSSRMDGRVSARSGTISAIAPTASQQAQAAGLPSPLPIIEGLDPSPVEGGLPGDAGAAAAGSSSSSLSAVGGGAGGARASLSGIDLDLSLSLPSFMMAPPTASAAAANGGLVSAKFSYSTPRDAGTGAGGAGAAVGAGASGSAATPVPSSSHASSSAGISLIDGGPGPLSPELFAPRIAAAPAVASAAGGVAPAAVAGAARAAVITATASSLHPAILAPLSSASGDIHPTARALVFDPRTSPLAPQAQPGEHVMLPSVDTMMAGGTSVAASGGSSAAGVDASVLPSPVAAEGAIGFAVQHSIASVVVAEAQLMPSSPTPTTASTTLRAVVAAAAASSGHAGDMSKKRPRQDSADAIVAASTAAGKPAATTAAAPPSTKKPASTIVSSTAAFRRYAINGSTSAVAASSSSSAAAASSARLLARIPAGAATPAPGIRMGAQRQITKAEAQANIAAIATARKAAATAAQVPRTPGAAAAATALEPFEVPVAAAWVDAAMTRLAQPRPTPRSKNAVASSVELALSNVAVPEVRNALPRHEEIAGRVAVVASASAEGGEQLPGRRRVRAKLEYHDGDADEDESGSSITKQQQRQQLAKATEHAHTEAPDGQGAVTTAATVISTPPSAGRLQSSAASAAAGGGAAAAVVVTQPVEDPMMVDNDYGGDGGYGGGGADAADGQGAQQQRGSSGSGGVTQPVVDVAMAYQGIGLETVTATPHQRQVPGQLQPCAAGVTQRATQKQQLPAPPPRTVNGKLTKTMLRNITAASYAGPFVTPAPKTSTSASAAAGGASSSAYAYVTPAMPATVTSARLTYVSPPTAATGSGALAFTGGGVLRPGLMMQSANAAFSDVRQAAAMRMQESHRHPGDALVHSRVEESQRRAATGARSVAGRTPAITARTPAAAHGHNGSRAGRHLANLNARLAILRDVSAAALPGRVSSFLPHRAQKNAQEATITFIAVDQLITLKSDGANGGVSFVSVLQARIDVLKQPLVQIQRIIESDPDDVTSGDREEYMRLMAIYRQTKDQLLRLTSPRVPAATSTFVMPIPPAFTPRRPSVATPVL